MSNGLEARVARLERAVEHALSVSLAEHDDADQAEARAKQAEIDKKAGEDALDAVRAEQEALAAGPAPAVEATETAEQRAADLGVDISTVQGTGVDGRVTVADVEAAAREA